jgi:hypothetical protein
VIDVAVRKLRAQRLAAQSLSMRAESVVLACYRVFALQAQDFVQAQWALVVRTRAARQADVAQAFASRQIVRAWSLRGTLHIVLAEDLPWLIRLLGKRNLQRAARRCSELGISERDVLAARKVLEKAIRGRTLSRNELHACLEGAGQSVAKQRGVQLLYCLTQAGVLCQAGEEFALVDDWIAHPRALVGDEALGELAMRYRAGHGPATVKDFAFWTGLSGREAIRAWEVAGAVKCTDAGVPSALLLPGYDEYLLGYADRSLIVDQADLVRLVPGGNGVFQPMLILEGRVRGSWRRRVDSQGATITLRPFAPLSAAHLRALESVAQEHGRDLGTDVTVQVDQS